MRQILLLLLLTSLSCFSQNVITIEAFVLDENTQQPIEFANVGFLEKGIGTVSDRNGKFVLRYDENLITVNDVLQLSTLGYASKSIPASQLFDVFGASNKVFLSSQTYDLTAVDLSNKTYEPLVIGNTNISEVNMGVWKNREALGGEIGTRVKVKNKNTRLKNLQFRIEENVSDSLLIRVNIYDYNKGYPKENLLSKNILHTVSVRNGMVEIPLKRYGIIVDDDIVVSIELVEVFGLQIGFAVAGSFGKGIAFTRTLSQDSWKKNSEVGMAFILDAEYSSTENKNTLKERPVAANILLYWDVSSAMEERRLSKELDLIKAYFKKNKKVAVEVVPFSHVPFPSRKFSIQNGKSDELRDFLSKQRYDGSANFERVLKTNPNEADIAFLFSSGQTLLEPLLPTLNIPVFSVNTLASANHYKLQEASFITDGHYLNLTKTSTEEAVKQVLFEMDDPFDYDKDARFVTTATVSGIVTTPNGVAQGAMVAIDGTFTATPTNLAGEYTIAAADGDVLTFSYLGMLPTKKSVSNQSNINVTLAPDGELLEEVLIAAKKKNEETIQTAFGKKKKDRLGLAGDQITSEEIGSQYSSLDDILVRLPGVIVTGFGANKRFLFARNRGSSVSLDTSPVIILNDIVYAQADTPYIDVQNIESITTLKSVMATNKYGNIAAGGAFYIKTKTVDLTAEGRPDGSQLLATGNDYVDELVPLNAAAKPSYLIALEKATSFEDAQNIYYAQKKKIEPTIPYFISVSNYFTKWDQDFASLVLSNISSLATTNVKALLSLAYSYEVQKDYINARSVYKHILKLQPSRSQTYRDLAKNLVELNKYQDAFELYKQILNNETAGVDFSGIQEIAETETRNLVARHKGEITYRDLPNSLLTGDFKQDIRMVFEWTDPMAEFEIQFVNPDKKYFNFVHTKFDTNEQLLDEIAKGYSCEQFLIDDAKVGIWVVNTTYLGNEPLKNPTYLKYTLYRNYGLPSQTKTTKMIELFNHSDKMTIDRFLN